MTRHQQRVATAVARASARFFNLQDPEDAPFPVDALMRPHTKGRRYALAHYNVVIPDLPEPHRYLACATIVGRTGTRAFDIDHAVVGSPRTTATLGLGTAATAPGWFGAYNTFEDCDLREDGSFLRLGNELTISGEFPTYRIRVQRPDFDLEIEAECTDQVTRYVRCSLYDHVGYPATYRGTLTWRGKSEPVEGVLSLEYARASTLAGLRDRPIPRSLKLPLDFFTYHVVKIKPDTLLMLLSTEGLGEEIATTAHLKQLGGESRRHPREVSFEVLSHREELQVAPDGATTRVPHQFRWTIRDQDRVCTELTGTTDTDLIYGLGRGWIGGFRYEGIHDDEPVAGSAYFEYVRPQDA